MITQPAASDRLHKDFSEIVNTVVNMQKIKTAWGYLDNAEYYEELEELRDKVKEAFDFYNQMIGKNILGPDAE